MYNLINVQHFVPWYQQAFSRMKLILKSKKLWFDNFFLKYTVKIIWFIKINATRMSIYFLKYSLSRNYHTLMLYMYNFLWFPTWISASVFRSSTLHSCSSCVFLNCRSLSCFSLASISFCVRSSSSSISSILAALSSALSVDSVAIFNFSIRVSLNSLAACSLLKWMQIVIWYNQT